jgi:hypothetical protein
MLLNLRFLFKLSRTVVADEASVKKDAINSVKINTSCFNRNFFRYSGGENQDKMGKSGKLALNDRRFYILLHIHTILF